MTRVISTRLKLSESPLVYAYDSPGVMLPFLGNGERGAERGVKLALIGPCASAPLFGSPLTYLCAWEPQLGSRRACTPRRRSRHICCTA